MLRFAPTFSAAAVLAVTLAATAPIGAGVLIKVLTAKDHIAIRHNDAGTRMPGGDDVRAIAAKESPVLVRYASLRVEPLRIEPGR